jgi:hypothetical protein
MLAGFLKRSLLAPVIIIFRFVLFRLFVEDEETAQSSQDVERSLFAGGRNNARSKKNIPFFSPRSGLPL